MRWLYLACACLSAALLAPPTGAAPPEGEKLLKFELRPISMQGRSGAPVQVDATIDVNIASLLQGHLVLAVTMPGENPLRYQTGPMVLRSGKQTVRLMLPALAQQHSSGQVDVAAHFVTSGSSVYLGSAVLSVPRFDERSLVVGISQPWQTPIPADGQILDLLRLSAYLPDKNSRMLSTYAARIAPDQLPTVPLAYCQFDLVVLIGDGFRFLNAHQLGAIRTWTRAGGSVFVMPRGTIQPHHLAFLRKLAGSAKVEQSLRLDRRGQLMALPEHGPAGTLLFNSELGRVALVTRPPASPDQINRAHWRKVAAFVWKITKEQTPHVIADGKWRKDLQRFSPSYLQTFSYDLPQEDYEEINKILLETVHYPTMAIKGGIGELISRLMPDSVRLVPLWLIAAILGLFVVTIGPVDYFVLGLVRKRRLTWVLFPLVTIGFTWLTVYLSNRSMGRSDYRHAFVVYDLDADGKVLRHSRYELLFTATQRQMITQVQRALLTPVDDRWFNYGSSYYYRSGYWGGPDKRDVPPMSYAGRIPDDYLVYHTIEQWTPQLTRTLSMQPADLPRKFNWSAVDPAKFHTEEGRRKVAQALLGDKRFAGNVEFFNGQTIYGMWGNSRSVIHSQGRRRYRGRTPTIDGVRVDSEKSFWDQISVRYGQGMFSVVSQISPNGAGDFEDLAILDPTDPGQWLLVVTEFRGKNVHMYRRLYRTDGRLIPSTKAGPEQSEGPDHDRPNNPDLRFAQVPLEGRDWSEHLNK